MDSMAPGQADKELHLFETMLKECCGVSLWRYSSDGSLLDVANPEQENFLLLLSAGNGLKRVLDRIDELESPAMICDAIGLLWSAHRLVDPQGPNEGPRLILLGPVFDGSFSLAELQSSTKRLKLGLKPTESILQELDRMPLISRDSFYRYAIMLHRILTGEVIDSGSIKTIEYPERPMPEENRTRVTDPGRALETEERLLQMIREGNPDFGKLARPLIENSPRDTLTTANELREQKNTVIVFTTLVSHAAREGGVAAATVLELRARYIREVENCRRASELTSVNYHMVDDFLNQVREARENKDVSRVVRACLEYIRLHVTEPFDLHEMADTLGYSDYYLSKKFAKETGEKISTKLRMARLERARMKLANTNETIQSISDELQFSSRNYFSKVFYETYGVTPREYREQYGVSSSLRP